jgi:hypothetical protein
VCANTEFSVSPDARRRLVRRNNAYTPPILLTLPLVAALWLANRFFYPRNLVQSAIETLAVSSIYGAGLL